MASREENNSGQNRTAWRSHLDQERQQLSASVEETLATSFFQDEQCDDGQYHTSRKTALIPPRLSLQSRALSAVRPESGVQSTTGMQPITRPEKEQKEPAPTQSRFKRFMQQLTSPFAAPSAPAHHEETSPQPRLEHPRSQETAVLPEVHAISSQALSYQRRDSSPVPTVVDAVPSARPPAMPVARSADDTGKQRVAGRNAKVRLETTPMPIVKPAAQPSVRTNQADSMPSAQTHHSESSIMREPVNVLVRALPMDKNGRDEKPTARQEYSGTWEEIAARPVSEERHYGTSTKEYPVATAREERAAVSGAAIFEHGQREHTVKNSYITSSSVVHVMLTANPGPVALHYVTLQPQIGFTVHLTGPTTVKTPFNYAII